MEKLEAIFQKLKTISPQKALWGGNGVLLLFLAYSLSIMTATVIERKLVGATPEISANQNQQNIPGRKSNQPLSRFQAILDINVFKAKRTKVTKSRTAPTQSVANPAATPTGKLPIDITLTGAMEMGEDSMAFVSSGGKGGEKVYRLAECLPMDGDEPSTACSSSQAKLAAVYENSIKVVMNNQQYIVQLGKGKSRQVARPAPVGRAGMAKRGTGGRRKPRKAKVNPFPSNKVGTATNMSVPQAEVSKAFENFSSILNQARAVPYFENGKPAGFQFRTLENGSIFQKLGMERMDIITSVNGQSLTTADQALQLFNVFKNETEISLEVTRKGQKQTLNYTVE